MADKQGDPLEKGVIGAFCRTYSVEDAIREFLSDVYEPCGKEGRYTYIGRLPVAWWYMTKGNLFTATTERTNQRAISEQFRPGTTTQIRRAGRGRYAGTPTTKLPSYQKCRNFCLADEKVRVTLGEEKLAGLRLISKRMILAG